MPITIRPAAAMKPHIQTVSRETPICSSQAVSAITPAPDASMPMR